MKNRVRSHPSRVRGLKSDRPVFRLLPSASHPSQVRGLKSATGAPEGRSPAVAPFPGAWIEILVHITKTHFVDNALFRVHVSKYQLNLF